MIPGRRPRPTVKMRNPAGAIVDVELTRNGDNPLLRRVRVQGLPPEKAVQLEPGWSFLTDDKKPNQ